MKITTLRELEITLAALPDGTTCNILASDLEAGNFETAHFESKSGGIFDIVYSGPVAEGYISPFDMQRIEEDIPV
jgi:hypothetical protein